MKSYLMNVWTYLDPLYYKCTRLQYLQGESESNTILRVRLTRYKGGPITLQDGTKILKNDLLLKIHLHNVRMLKELEGVSSEVKRAVYIYHMVKRSLPSLAAYLSTHQKSSQIKGIIGITSLKTGASRLGFELAPIKSKYYVAYKKITLIPIQLVAGKKRLNQEPVYLFMSKQHLLGEYR
ncbi:YkoP family protein [Oceanobacillus kapialis]|uniref:YkoP family protein n=1 Tax=Oceanobacillus kapialis TaxID=481353 RepID=UPI00384EEAA1